jgi:hypothetical protein
MEAGQDSTGLRRNPLLLDLSLQLLFNTGNLAAQAA